jgi:translation initiation factor 3 subunit B
MTDDEYFRSQPDYADFAPYLEGNTDQIDLPEFVPDYSSVIIVDNIPAVGPEKLTKLKGALLKIYRKIHDGLSEDDIDMQLDAGTQMTLGFCFIKFPEKSLAENAMAVTQDFAIDKKHKFIVSMYTDLDKYGNMSNEYIEKEYREFKPRPDPSAYLADPSGRDQFVMRHDNETEIYWGNNTAGDKPTIVYDGSSQRNTETGTVWCESYVQWSPKGTYLATFHPRGVKIWGNASFEDQGKFGHDGVQELDFSPCEKYMITYAFPNDNNDLAMGNGETMIVWDILNQSKLHSFKWKNPLLPYFQVSAKTYIQTEKMLKENKDAECHMIKGRINNYDNDTYEFSIDGNDGKLYENIHHSDVTPLQDPNKLKWSPDGNYVAKIDIHAKSGTDIISIYELPSMKLNQKKSLATAGAIDFSWSPKKNMFAYLKPATGNQPAGITIVGIPDRVDLCSRIMHQVSDGRMVWQDQGDYLCVYMTKMVGKKRSQIVMLFRVCEPSCPVELKEINEQIHNISWEPNGDRLAIVTGEQRTTNISFYSMSGVAKDINASGVSVAAERQIPGLAPSKQNKIIKKEEKKELTLLFTLNNMQATDVIWSPAGGIAALAFFASDTCMFELHDVDNNVNLASRRHDRGNRLVWDPSGRILVSCTITDIKNARMRGHPSDGYIMYTFQGHVLNQVSQEKLFQFSWRPRPKDLLTNDEKKKIIKNLKKYEKEFDKEDRLKRDELKIANQTRRRAQASDFLTRLSYNQNLARVMKQNRIRSRDGYDSDDDNNYVFTTVQEETVMKTIEQIVGSQSN